MPLHSKFRWFTLVSAAAFLPSVLAIFNTAKPHGRAEVAYQIPVGVNEHVELEPANVAQVASSQEPEKDSSIIAPTDFYVASDDPEVVVKPRYKFNEQQVNLQNTLPLYLLQGGDLLASHCLLASREFVTDQQVLDAQLLVKQYDSQLKEIRRQKAAILEQAGVTISDPEKELAIVRARAYCVYAEARLRICDEVLTAEQLKLMFEKHQTKQAEARRIQKIKQAAEKLKISEQRF